MAFHGQMAVIIVSDGREMDDSPLVSAKKMAQQYGDRLCIYTVVVGDDPAGEELLNKIALTSLCGFSVSASSVETEEDMAAFVREMLRGAEEVPGVTSAGVALGAPFAGGAATMSYVVEGIMPAEGEDYVSEYQVVTHDYFRTMGIPILEGRGLEASDGEGEGDPFVTVVNQAFARRHWGDETV